MVGHLLSVCDDVSLCETGPVTAQKEKGMERNPGFWSGIPSGVLTLEGP